MYSHLFDIIGKLGMIFLAIIIGVEVPWLEKMGFAPVLVLIIIFLGLYYLYGRTLTTYLYCRFSLGMILPLEQAKTLNDAFSPILGTQWLPMKELKTVDDHLKYETALAIFQDWKKKK